MKANDSNERLVAMSELARLHDLAMNSESQQVQAFGLLICERIALLADEETLPYRDSQEDLEPLIDIGRRLNAEADDDEGLHV
jgi:hypothetical protein